MVAEHLTIVTLDDVRAFFKILLGEYLNFHPDTPMDDYINVDTHEATYTPAQAAIRQAMLDKCFEVCEVEKADIYEIACDIFQPLLGADYKN